MTQAGGPAAINGFLYQIIQHIRWLASVTLSRELNGQEIKNARIVLEPHYGGDASLEASGIFLVEQYKTRKNGTWSVSNIISILRDLRAAVPSSLPKKALYRFVTDGRAGRLNSFYDFLAEIKSVEKLDDLTDCNCEYFDRLIVDTRNCKLPSDTKTKECAIVFHLLSNFEMEFSFDAVTSITEIEKFFRLLSPNLGEEREMREHLVGVLLGELSKGATNLDRAKIVSLFRRVGLSPERLGRITTLSETMSELTRHRLANIKYNSKQDVRSIPEWPEDKSVLLITGESGSGKSWQLARLLEEYAKARKIFTLVFSANTIEEVLFRIARDLWQTGLGETSDLTLGAVSNFLCELMPDTAIKAIVAVDDVQDIGLARNLLSQDWVSWNMRLILTVPYSVGRSLQLNDNENAHVHRINNFSVDELDTLLKINGQRWSDLPRDLGKLLCSPILASIFLKLPYNSIQNALHSEYEIFEKFWLRIIEKGRSGDEGIVTALADYFYQGKPYPLPRSIWSHVGLDGLALERLDAAGWLHCLDNGEVAFAHDRLLNWVVAKSLVYQFQSKKLPVADLGVFLIGKNDENRHIRRRLNYVTMDTFWLLAEAEQNLETLDQLIVQLEGSRDFGSYGENFYTRLLPTLGQRAVTILLYRLHSIIADSNDDYRISLIGKAFANLAHQKSVDLENPIDSLLKNPCWSWQKVAIAILKVAPDASRLDRLWEIHQQCYKAFETKTANDSHRDYQDCFAALRAAIALNPDWLHHRIIRADANAEPVSELGYQLNVLEHIEAFPIWKETRDVLMEKTPASKSRSLIHCIARFFDYEKTDFVIRHLSSSTDSSSMSALATLSVLDPLTAINRLTEVQESESYFSVIYGFQFFCVLNLS
ncbi:MAG: ATP-binding protein [Betaproteobacteria bacterium]|nr:ATP-binding protein [Betaproteobacteria bacterium]